MACLVELGIVLVSGHRVNCVCGLHDQQRHLARFVIFGTRHLDHLVNEFVVYYNNHRSHSSRESLPPIRHMPNEFDTIQLDEIVVKSHVGGLVKPFERKVA